MKSFSGKQAKPWGVFRQALWYFNQRAELKRLSSWARKKNLKGPLRLYEYRLKDTEQRIHRVSLRSKRETQWAYLVHLLSCLITTTPRYPRKGIAAHYKVKRKIIRRSHP